MTSQTFHQQIQRNKYAQRTTRGLIIDGNMRNMRDKKHLFQLGRCKSMEKQQQINTGEQPTRIHHKRQLICRSKGGLCSITNCIKAPRMRRPSSCDQRSMVQSEPLSKNPLGKGDSGSSHPPIQSMIQMQGGSRK